MGIKGLIIDVGGVLVQTIDTSKRKVWEKKLNLVPGELTNEVYLIEPADKATVGLANDHLIWQDIQKRFQLSDEELTHLIQDFSAGDKLNVPFYTYLKTLRSHYKSLILSNAWDDAREIYTKQYHLDEVVDEMIISAEVGMRKPDEKIFELALKHLDTTPEETLFIDDTIENVIEAQQLGIHSILFIDNDTTMHQMKKILG
jgi:HAD superfamily hydrolase (TIGR01549 family)